MVTSLHRSRGLRGFRIAATASSRGSWLAFAALGGLAVNTGGAMGLALVVAAGGLVAAVRSPFAGRNLVRLPLGVGSLDVR